MTTEVRGGGAGEGGEGRREEQSIQIWAMSVEKNRS